MTKDPLVTLLYMENMHSMLNFYNTSFILRSAQAFSSDMFIWKILFPIHLHLRRSVSTDQFDTVYS